MDIKALDLGPVLGHTTHQSVSITGRGSPSSNTQESQCYVVARCQKRTQNQHFENEDAQYAWSAVDDDFDFMGLMVFEELVPNTVYQYQAGTFHSESAPDLSDIRTADWSEPPICSFRTFRSSSQEPVSFIIGSCRNIRKKKSGKWYGAEDGEDGDLTFKNLLERFPPISFSDVDSQVDFIMMTGDQVYADNAKVWPFGWEKAESFEQFVERYHKAYKTKNMARLLAHYPTYMTWDDHEVMNDWPPNPEKKKKQRQFSRVFKQAARAYKAYQVLQSPIGNTNTPPYWYDFTCASAEFFVMDVRSERNWIGRVRGDMISESQKTALEKWLLSKENQGPSFKFIVSAVPVFPDGKLPYLPGKPGGNDIWRGYKAQRKEILDFIREKDISRVVFLSGDVHASLSAQLKIGKEGSPWLFNIIASAFHWHTFGWNDSSFFINEYLKDGDGNRTDYFVEKINDKVCTDNNFVKIDCDPENNQLVVTIFDGKTGEIFGKPTTLSF